MCGVDKQELANYLETLDLLPSTMHDIKTHFGLPDPYKPQWMNITLCIKVNNMDAMGDTYQMGRKYLKELGVPHKVVDLIDVVVIVERTGE